jgi:opacity protein-like surface antigen
MRLLATTAIVLALGATGAIAADAPDLIIDDEPIAVSSDWDGIYIGVGGHWEMDINNPFQYVGGVGIVGANVTMDSFLLGAEAYVGGQTLVGAFAPFWIAGGEVRAGFLASEQFLLYAALGGEIIQGGATFWTAGGGLEFMVADNMSVDLEGDYVQGISSGYQAVRFGASLNWHFD